MHSSQIASPTSSHCVSHTHFAQLPPPVLHPAHQALMDLTEAPLPSSPALMLLRNLFSILVPIFSVTSQEITSSLVPQVSSLATFHKPHNRDSNKLLELGWCPYFNFRHNPSHDLSFTEERLLLGVWSLHLCTGQAASLPRYFPMYSLFTAL